MQVVVSIESVRSSSAVNMNFENTFKSATVAMRLNRCHPALIRDKLWMFQFAMITILNMGCCGLLTYSIVFHDIRQGKFTEASKNAVMIIVSLTIQFKYVILLRHQNDINNIIGLINEDYISAENLPETQKNIITGYKKRGVKICKIWLAMSVCSAFVFPLKAFAMMGYLHWKGKFELIPMFDYTYPYFVERYKNLFPVYCTLFGITFSFSVFASTMYTGFDPIVPIIMLHYCGQIEVISLRTLKIFSQTTSEQELNENLKEIIKKLQVIYRVIDIVKTDFTILYEFTMKTTTLLMPLSAFQVVENLKNKDSNVEFIPFLIGTVIHCYMPCYYSDLLMEKNEELRQAIYASGWERGGVVRARKTLLFVLMRATRPLVIKTVFSPICLDTFAEMCRTSYAIFNIMTAAWT